MPSSPVLRKFDCVRVVLTTPPAKLMPSAQVSRTRSPEKVVPLVPPCIHAPTLACSIHKFWMVELAYAPPSASCGALSLRTVSSPKRAKSDSWTFVLTGEVLPKMPTLKPSSTEYQGPAPRTVTLLTLMWLGSRYFP